MIRPADKPACAESGQDPELWFPDPYQFRHERGELFHEATRGALIALTICSQCPLFANGQCLETAMEDISTIDYGIWGGTLPNERRKVVGSNIDSDIWQVRLRREADKKGLIKPLVTPRERPRSSLWEYVDAKSLCRNGSDWS